MNIINFVEFIINFCVVSLYMYCKKYMGFYIQVYFWTFYIILNTCLSQVWKPKFTYFFPPKYGYILNNFEKYCISCLFPLYYLLNQRQKYYPSLYIFAAFSAKALQHYRKIGDISGLFSNNINKNKNVVKTAYILFLKCL